MANNITLARAHTIFAVAETVRGTLVFPAATDLVVPAGYGNIGQVPTHTDSEEIVNSRSLMAQFRDALPAGDWSLPMFLRPSGTAGTAPQGNTLFNALFGSRAVVASTSVTYSLATSLPSFSLWTKFGDTVFFASGASADQAKLQITKKGALKLDMSGKFMVMGWCGTDALSSPITYVATPITAISVGNAKKYTVGSKVIIGTSTNGGAGHAVTAVNVSTNTLTVSPGVSSSQLNAAVVAPFLPTGTIVGSPIESRTCSLSLDGGSTSIKIKSMDLTINNGIKYMEEEISNVENPTDYVEDKRSASGTMTIIMRSDDLQYFYDSLATGVTKNVLISMGATAGSRAALAMPTARLKAPKLNPSAPTVELSMDVTALGNTGEDEISLAFT